MATKMGEKKIWIVFALVLLFATNYLILAQEDKTIEDFLKTPENFLSEDNNVKNLVWSKASFSQRNKFALELAKKYSGIKEIDISSNELKWDGDKLTNGKAEIRFKEIPDYITKIVYDEKTKSFIYYYKEKEFKFDEGYINKKGEHVVQKKGRLLEGISRAILGEDKKIINLFYGATGKIEYKNGRYYIYEDGYIKIGKDYYGVHIKGVPAEIEISDNIRAMNSKIMLMETENSETASVVISTASSYPINIFTDGKDHSELGDSYASVNLKDKTIIMNGIGSDGKEHYIDANIFQDFEKISGKGSQTWLTNGKFKMSFAGNGIYSYTAPTSAKYNVYEITNLNSGKTMSLLYDYGYFDLFDIAQRVRKDILGEGVLGPAGKYHSGSSYKIEHAKKYERYKGEELIDALTQDPDTTVSLALHRQIPSYMLAGNLQDKRGQGIQEFKLDGGFGKIGFKEAKEGLTLFSDYQNSLDENGNLDLSKGEYNKLINYFSSRPYLFSGRVEFGNNYISANGNNIDISPEIAGAIRNNLIRELIREPGKFQTTHYGLRTAKQKMINDNARYGYRYYGYAPYRVGALGGFK